MIKINARWKVILSFLLAFALWSFTLVNTQLFGASEKIEGFNAEYYIISLVSCILIFALGAFKIKSNKKVQLVLGIAAYIAAVLGSVRVAIFFSGGFKADTYIFFVNAAFYLFFAAIALIISGSMRASALTALAVSYIFNVASFIIYCFRGTSLSPTDIYGIKTAMNVAVQYKFVLKYEIITATVAAVMLAMLVCKFPLRLKFRRSPLILRGFGAAAAILCAVFIASVDIYRYDISTFDQYYANLNYGSAFGFYANTIKMGLKKHSTYDPEQLNGLLCSYENTASLSDDKPNVVVIMNESFSDLSVVGEFSTNTDCLEYTHSLTDNVKKGELLVSVFGGYTCNSEYEFLTGMNTGMLATDALPYMQMIFDTVPYSMASHMKALGYHTVAFHPYYKSGWNRVNVYNYMGFDEFINLENIGDLAGGSPVYMRGFMSDASDYDTVMSILRSGDTDRRDFIFNVTMQNHGGYQYDDFEADVKITDMDGTYPQAEQYLSLIKLSDDAIRRLIGELQDFEEPTVVLIFGDHQPGVEKEFFEELYGRSLEDLTKEEYTRRYMVPFMIWANYDIEEETGLRSSPSFLSGLLLDTAGLPKSRVQLYLDDVQKYVAQLNPIGWFDPWGGWHYKPETAELEDYYNLQYAILTNEKLNYDFDFSEPEEEPETEMAVNVAETAEEEKTEDGSGGEVSPDPEWNGQ